MVYIDPANQLSLPHEIDGLVALHNKSLEIITFETSIRFFFNFFGQSLGFFIDIIRWYRRTADSSNIFDNFNRRHFYLYLKENSAKL